ncbi:hypothetical protein V6N12_040638 [Hibiscus sabdariffa]|uniref:Uncharacterized protein n=1 Tax=Hibiscus sabdariffa TaxID=183260 RepID=A0ABR2E7X5_9ROSI
MDNMAEFFPLLFPVWNNKWVRLSLNDGMSTLHHRMHRLMKQLLAADAQKHLFPTQHMKNKPSIIGIKVIPTALLSMINQSNKERLTVPPPFTSPVKQQEFSSALNELDNKSINMN